MTVGVRELSLAGLVFCCGLVTFALAEPPEVASEQTILDRMDQPIVATRDFKNLNQLTDWLRQLTLTDVVVDTASLEIIGLPLDCETRIETQGVSLGNALDRMLRPHDLTWTVQDGVVVITTEEEAEQIHSTHVYEVNRFGLDFDTLIELITMIVEPDSWEEVGGPGSIDGVFVHGKMLLAVRNTPRIHRNVERLFRKIESAARLPQVVHEESLADESSSPSINIGLLRSPAWAAPVVHE